jgi:hypothetical protein
MNEETIVVSETKNGCFFDLSQTGSMWGSIPGIDRVILGHYFLLALARAGWRAFARAGWRD